MRVLDRFRIPGVAILAGSAVLLTSGVAQAAPAAVPPVVHMHVAYSGSWQFKSHTLGRCVNLRATGTITYTVQALPNPRNPPPEFAFRSISLRNPVLRATVTTLAKNKCTSRNTLNKISIGQRWTGFACNFNPSLQVDLPWQIGFSAWPSCGNRKQAGFTTTYGKNSSYQQSNSGSPSSFGPKTILQNEGAPCYGVFASTVAFVGGKSDSFGASNGSGARKVCLRK